MYEEARARFDVGADKWCRYSREPLGRIRHEVIWLDLSPYLPPVGDAQEPPRVLDAGGGSGELALRLVQRGYCVWLLDYAPAMLDRARQAAQDLPPDARRRLQLCAMPVEEVSSTFAPGLFSAVCCHTLVEYLPEPLGVLRKLTGLLCDGGLLSLSFVNRHSQLLRRVWSRSDPVGALAELGQKAFSAELFGLSGKAYTAEEVSCWLAELKLASIATFGVRIFSDYLPRARLEDPEFLDAVLRLETAAAALSPYREIARYIHILARSHSVLREETGSQHA